jgi:hypothetical protein
MFVYDKTSNFDSFRSTDYAVCELKIFEEPAGFIQRFAASADRCYYLNEACVLTTVATVHCFNAFELLILCNCSVKDTY